MHGLRAIAVVSEVDPKKLILLFSTYDIDNVRMYVLEAIELKKDGNDDWEVEYVKITDKQKKRVHEFDINGKVTSEPKKFYVKKGETSKRKT